MKGFGEFWAQKLLNVNKVLQCLGLICSSMLTNIVTKSEIWRTNRALRRIRQQLKLSYLRLLQFRCLTHQFKNFFLNFFTKRWKHWRRWIFANSDRNEQALTIISRSLELSPDYANALDTKGFIINPRLPLIVYFLQSRLGNRCKSFRSNSFYTLKKCGSNIWLQVSQIWFIF